MDAAGLAFGILSTFNVIVEDIRLIRIAKSFGTDYQAAELKIRMTECRLVRWAKSVGLTEHDIRITKPSDISLVKLIPEENRKIAYAALQEIAGRLSGAKTRMGKLDSSDVVDEGEAGWRRKISGHHIFGKKHKEASVPSYIDQSDSAAELSTLARSFEKLSTERYNNTSVSKKAQWTLFVKDELNGLLSEVRERLEDLEGLFPKSSTDRHEMAAEEANLAQSEELGKILKEVVEERKVRDEALLQAVTEMMGTVTDRSQEKEKPMVSTPFSGSNSGIFSGNSTHFTHSPVTFGGRGK